MFKSNVCQTFTGLYRKKGVHEKTNQAKLKHTNMHEHKALFTINVVEHRNGRTLENVCPGNTSFTNGHNKCS